MYFDTDTELHYQFLRSLGETFRLDLEFDLGQFEEEVENLSDHWRQYNPRKNIDRYGMSLTSLDGSTSGVPDLDSVWEYNKKNNTNLNDMSFRTPTEALKGLPSISAVIEPFIPHLGRSHLIKLNQGGFFPPHRDAYFSKDNSFRLFAPLTGCSEHTFVFLINGERVRFEPARMYFINTRLEHAVFSFENSATMLILNVELCDPVIKLVSKRLGAK